MPGLGHRPLDPVGVRRVLAGDRRAGRLDRSRTSPSWLHGAVARSSVPGRYTTCRTVPSGACSVCTSIVPWSPGRSGGERALVWSRWRIRPARSSGGVSPRGTARSSRRRTCGGPSARVERRRGRPPRRPRTGGTRRAPASGGSAGSAGEQPVEQSAVGVDAVLDGSGWSSAHSSTVVAEPAARAGRQVRARSGRRPARAGAGTARPPRRRTPRPADGVVEHLEGRRDQPVALLVRRDRRADEEGVGLVGDGRLEGAVDPCRGVEHPRLGLGEGHRRERGRLEEVGLGEDAGIGGGVVAQVVARCVEPVGQRPHRGVRRSQAGDTTGDPGDRGDGHRTNAAHRPISCGRSSGRRGSTRIIRRGPSGPRSTYGVRARQPSACRTQEIQPMRRRPGTMPTTRSRPSDAWSRRTGSPQPRSAGDQLVVQVRPVAGQRRAGADDQVPRQARTRRSRRRPGRRGVHRAGARQPGRPVRDLEVRHLDALAVRRDGLDGLPSQRVSARSRVVVRPRRTARSTSTTRSGPVTTASARVRRATRGCRAVAGRSGGPSGRCRRGPRGR